MSYARLQDGSIFHFPTLAGSEGVIDVPPVHELEEAVHGMVADSIPLFVKSLAGGYLKRRHAARYTKVNRARLVLMRACAERLLTEGFDA